MGMATRDDQGKGGRCETLVFYVLKHLADVAHEAASGHRKTLWAGVGFPVIQYPNVEIDVGRQPGDRLSDMPAADDEKRNAGQYGEIGDSLLQVGLGTFRQR